MEELSRIYSYYYIENFHRFKNPVKFQLRPFTILVGPNGSGKSAISLAIELFYDSCKIILYDSETRKNFFKNKTKYSSSLIYENGNSIIREEFGNTKQFLEFSYKKNEEFIDISAVEFGEINEDGSKKKYIRIETNFPTSSYLENLKYNDLGDTWWDKKFTDEENSELREYLEKIYNATKHRITHPWLKEKSVDHLGYVTYISDDFWESENKIDFEINFDLLKVMLFQERKFYVSPKDSVDPKSHPTFNLSDLEPVGRKKLPQNREPNPLDYFIDKHGIEKLNEFSVESIINHLIISANLSLHIESELNSILEEFNLLWKLELLDETRPKPSKYLKFKNNKVINDYFGLVEVMRLLELNNEMKLFLKALKEFEIADEIKVQKVGYKKPNMTFYEIQLNYKGFKFPIKNLSSGGKQILPIIIKVFDSYGPPKLTIIKQPELHLHPRLQMKIPDLLFKYGYLRRSIVDTSFSVDTYIIETHSEHIIRKFQLLIANSEYPDFTNKDIAIIYVQPDERTLNSSIKIMELDEKGNFIDNWPAGFFDESAELSYALLEAQIKRKN